MAAARQLSFAIAAAFLFLHASPAHAGAWLRRPGQKLLIYELSRYENTSQFDNQGDSRPQKRYDQWQNKRYYEFGLRQNLTVGTTLFPQVVVRPNTPTVAGLASAEIFARTPLWRDEHFVLSFQPLVKFPGTAFYSTGERFGAYHSDIGASLLGGLNFKAFGLTHFADAELGYRLRFGTPKNQVRAQGTLGLRATKNIMLMPQLFANWRATMPAVVRYTQTSGDDYTNYQAGLSAVYHFNSLRALQLGYVKDLNGKNTGDGHTFLIALWLNF